MAGVPAGRLSIEIVAEIARLQADLDKAKAAVRAASADIGTSARAANDNLGKLGQGGRLAGHHMQNLAFQFQDLGVQMVQAAQSSHPLKGALTALMQQGSQIYGIMGQAGIGVGGLVKQIGRMLAGLGPAALVVGALGLGIAGLTADINENSKVHVTWMDTLIGVYDGIAAAITTTLGGAFEWLGATTSAVFHAIWEAAKSTATLMIGSMVAVPRMIIAGWSAFPAAIGEAFYAVANIAIRAVNFLIWSSIKPINDMIATANMIGEKFGLGGLSQIAVPQIAQLANPFAGAGAQLARVTAGAFKASFVDYIGNAEGYFKLFIEGAAGRREAAEAGKATGGKAGKAAGGAAGKALHDEMAEWLAKTVKEVLDSLAGIAKSAGGTVQSAVTSVFDKLGRLFDEEKSKAAKAYEDQLQRVNGQLQDMVGLLGNIGGAGGAIGGLINGIMGGSFSSLGSAGGLVDILLNKKDYTKQADIIADRIAEVFGTSGPFSKTVAGLLQGAGVGSIAGAAIGKNNLGSALGGAAGQAIGGSALKFLGSAAGPVGAILGGIIGGLLGGLFSKAKTGSASVTNGGISLGGNNADARGNTGGIGGSVQSSLGKIIEALGGTAGAYGFTIGQRNDEFRVSGSAGADVTGKNPSGLLYKGKSAEEAARVALLNAINDGAVAGIREGAANLLKAGTDLEAALSKALKFNAVFDELAKEMDPVAFATAAIAKEMADLRKIFDEAGASASDYAALEQLAAIKQARAYNEAIRPQRELEVQIMQLEGKAAEALAAQRALELGGLNATLRPLQERIYALTDEAAAVQAAAQTKAAADAELAAKTAANDNERSGLLQKLFDLQDSALGKAFRRMTELAAMTDDANRALQMQIYVAEDVAAARATLTNSYQRERATLTGLANDFRGFASSLFGLRQSLYANDNAASIGSVQSALGNLGDSAGASSAVRGYLDSARSNARTLVDYQREVGKVARMIDGAIASASSQASAYDAQIAALDKSVEGLIEVNDSVISVHDAIETLNALLVPPTVDMANARREADGAAAQFQASLVAEVRAMREEATAASLKMIEIASETRAVFKRADGENGLRISSSNADPIITQAAA